MAAAFAAALAPPLLPATLPLPTAAAVAAAAPLASVSTKYLSGKSEETPPTLAGNLCLSVCVGITLAVGVAVVDTGSCCSGSSTKAEPSKRLAGVTFAAPAPGPTAAVVVVVVVPLNLGTCCCCCCCS